MQFFGGNSFWVKVPYLIGHILQNFAAIFSKIAYLLLSAVGLPQPLAKSYMIFLERKCLVIGY